MRKTSTLMALGMVLALALPAPLSAQRPPGPPEGLFGPRLEGLFDRLFDRIEPGMAELRALIEDWSAWHAPEVLPNGDILIRRRRPPGQSSEPLPEPEAVPSPTEPLAAEPPLPDAPIPDSPVTEPFEL